MVAYNLVQAGNWVCEQTKTPFKESLSYLIKVGALMSRSPAERLQQARSGLTEPGWTKTETIGFWWMDPDSLSLSETCSESLGVNLTRRQHGPCQTIAQSHRGVRTSGKLCKNPNLQQDSKHTEVWVEGSQPMEKLNMRPLMGAHSSRTIYWNWLLKPWAVPTAEQGERE